MSVRMKSTVDQTPERSGPTNEHDAALDGPAISPRGAIDAFEPAPAFASVATLLRREHARLDEIYEQLLGAYRSGDWTEVQSAWNVFERGLRAHMETEETFVFSSLRAVDAAEADALASEHEEIRKALDVLGVNIELHALTRLDADELVCRLRAHATREERMLYPWVESTFPVPESPGQ